MIKDLIESTKNNKSKRVKKNKRSDSEVGKVDIFLSSSVDILVLAIPRLILLFSLSLIGSKYRLALITQINIFYGGIENFSILNKKNFLFFSRSSYAKIMYSGMIGVILLGFVYRVIMWISPYSATIGQRFMKIVVVKRDSFEKITVFNAFVRAFLMYFAWIFPVLIVLHWKDQKYLSIILLILASIWNDPSIFFRNSGTLSDIASRTRNAYGYMKDGNFTTK